MDGEDLDPAQLRGKPNIIKLATYVFPDADLAIGLNQIQHRNTRRTQCASILGNEYTQDQACLEGGCLRFGLRKLRKVVEHAEKHKVLRSDPRTDLGDKQPLLGKTHPGSDD